MTMKNDNEWGQTEEEGEAEEGRAASLSPLGKMMKRSPALPTMPTLPPHALPLPLDLPLHCASPALPLMEKSGRR